MLRREMNQMRGAQQPHPTADPYAQDQYGRSRQPELPPLRSLQSPTGPPAPDSMTGVQYDAPRVNGYRPGEPSRF